MFFSPVLIAIIAGQVTLLVLFGLVASLYLIEQEKYVWAGAALILTSPKPHLVMLVGPYLLLDMAMQQQWRGWVGLA
jgi:Gpi18-like mannosyltransferase